MGTRSLTVIREDGKDLLIMYRQYDGYPSGMGEELKTEFGETQMVNGISDHTAKIANGLGCLGAQIVAHFKTKPGNVYLHSEVGDGLGAEFIYYLSEKAGEVWLDLTEGEMTMFGLPGTKPEKMECLYSGPLGKFNSEVLEEG